ncbi:MAG TPA: alpha/beta fold hydrolase [Candidatus Binatia bacterium]|nr:alpha/beta fold hydrolase [Candidatus Binatia bacterium]
MRIPESRGGRPLDLPSPEDRVVWSLRHRVEGGSPLGEGARATVTFDAGHAAWSVVIRGKAIELVPDRVPRPDTVVRADAVTLASVLAGDESGVYAFLDGRLTIRGNMALAIRLDAVDDPGRPPAFPRARTARTLDVETFYLEAGRGHPVVLLHGLGATNASMLPTLAELARDHRVLAPDLPGFGDSGKPVRTYDPAFYARWLVSFLDAVGVARATLVGNSMGGRVAIEVGLTAPERVDRLVLFAPSLAFKRFREATPLVRLVAAELGAMPIMVPRTLVARAIRLLFARPERLRDAWYDAAADEFVRVFASARGRMAFFSAARQIYLEEATGEHGFWDRLPALSRPALFLWGEADQLVPARFGPHVVAAVPRARSVVLEDCGHVPQFEQPERTHELVRGFLRQ